MIVMRDMGKIVKFGKDGFGDKVLEEVTDIECLFLQSTSRSHASNAEISASDAHVYLDIDNPAIKGLGYKIEGMYFCTNPLGTEENDSWYKIARVIVGQRKLINNEVDNVHAFLEKVVEPKLK